MGIIRTVVAECDGKVFNGPSSRSETDLVRCGERVTLDPDRGQPFHQLSEIGWSTAVHGHEMVTYCPACTKARSVPARPGGLCRGCGAELSVDYDLNRFLPMSKPDSDMAQCRADYAATGETPSQAWCSKTRRYV